MKTNTEKAEALATLKKHLKRGATVYTVLRSVSSTGMSRTLDVYTIEKNQPLRLTWSAAKVLGRTVGRASHSENLFPQSTLPTMKTQKWTETENKALVYAYIAMLNWHHDGTKYSKAAQRRFLIGTREHPGHLAARSPASIEFKLMNVSGCLKALGKLTLPGYAPAMNYQRDLMAEVCKAFDITATTPRQ